MESIESTADIRVQKALERGFIRPDATEIEIRLGLEDMHESPLDKDGPFKDSPLIGAVAISSELQNL